MIKSLVDWPWPERTFMARLTPVSRNDLLRLGAQFYCPPGRVLMRQGEAGSSVYLLRSRDATVSACAKITADDGKLFAIRVSGDVIGELGALEPHSRRSATATVCTDTIAHCIPGPEFVAFLDRHTDTWQTLCRAIVDRLAWSDQQRLDFADCPVPVRLARLLVEFAESYGRREMVFDGESEVETCKLTVRLSYEELGQLIGAKVDAVGLAMREMREARLLCLNNRHVAVRDLEGLRRSTIWPC
ncbi:Crp/Fnr family transcriptional regulator [Nocardia sp. 2]|uniref:Crp/Fnr family transcriptional regulator n=1 Tax=Nocardia acididurans TaxID=2802282 RepID=A0ABS1M8S9_9NOCA|nr:Crp/Fnr family transcriptional regulator [Nocardia acididurans]MBL1076149.1 Crp/Fnr family transcriptional regulator [Nocardia acididurans]